MKYISYYTHESQCQIVYNCPLALSQWRRETKDGKVKPCRRQRCPCQVCRQSWASERAILRQQSFRVKPPTHTLVIHPPSNDLWNKHKSAFFDKLKYQFRRKRKLPFEYDAQCEFARLGRSEFTSDDLHVHLDIITDSTLAPRLIKTIVKDALHKLYRVDCLVENLPVDCPTYCDVVHNPQGLARYTPKDMRTKTPTKIPADYPQRRRLTSSSRGFYTKAKKTLWHEWIAEHYPPVNKLDANKKAAGMVWNCPNLTLSPSPSMPSEAADGQNGTTPALPALICRYQRHGWRFGWVGRAVRLAGGDNLGDQPVRFGGGVAPAHQPATPFCSQQDTPRTADNRSGRPIAHPERQTLWLARPPPC